MIIFYFDNVFEVFQIRKFINVAQMQNQCLRVLYFMSHELIFLN
jgi:hypothetical protein